MNKDYCKNKLKVLKRKNKKLYTVKRNNKYFSAKIKQKLTLNE